MALNHSKMRRILDKYFREPGRSLTRQWDGNAATLQAYLDEEGVFNCTAKDIEAKEVEYDAFVLAQYVTTASLDIIKSLEAAITPRRMREAMLPSATQAAAITWIQDQETLIASERAKLKA